MNENKMFLTIASKDIEVEIDGETAKKTASFAVISSGSDHLTRTKIRKCLEDSMEECIKNASENATIRTKKAEIQIIELDGLYCMESKLTALE